MSIIRLSVVVFLCVSAAWALPKRSISNGAPSGAGEIPNESPPDYPPFDPSLGKGFPSSYDLDPEGSIPLVPEYDVNDIEPHAHPHGEEPEPPSNPDDRSSDKDHSEEEAHEPSSHENPEGGEDTDDGDEEDKTETQEGEEEKAHASEEEDEKKPHGDEEEETHEVGDDAPLPFNTALFTFQQVNHYIKQLEKAMDHVFKESLEEAALLNNTFANTTEEEVEVDGHKYKIQKSILKTGYDDKNNSLFIEAVSSVGKEIPKKERKERSNPDSERIQ